MCDERCTCIELPEKPTVLHYIGEGEICLERHVDDDGEFYFLRIETFDLRHIIPIVDLEAVEQIVERVREFSE